MKKTKYENSHPFKFLPGHVVLLSSLPEYISKFDSEKTVTIQKRKRKQIQIETTNHPNSPKNTKDDVSESNSNVEHFDVEAPVAKSRFN